MFRQEAENKAGSDAVSRTRCTGYSQMGVCEQRGRKQMAATGRHSEPCIQRRRRLVDTTQARRREWVASRASEKRDQTVAKAHWRQHWRCVRELVVEGGARHSKYEDPPCASRALTQPTRAQAPATWILDSDLCSPLFVPLATLPL